jgi:hypothetical protein
MKRSFVLISALLFLFAAQSSSFALGARPASPSRPQEQQAAPLNNADVVEMVKTGLSADIIVAKIKASVSKFDTSPAALQQLKAAGVPEAVILAMVQAPVGVPPARSEEDDAAVPGATHALVYVYRKKNFGTRNMQPSVYADGAEVARMDDGRYFILKLDPGKHTIEVNKGHSGAEIDMKAGRKYYFRVEMVPGFWKARGKIDYMQREQGELEIQKMKPLDAKWIKDKSKVSVEELTSQTQ